MQNRNLNGDLRVYDCGVCAYHDVLNLQHDMCRHRWQEKIGNTVLIVEHPPVITLGARESENKLLHPEQDLMSSGINIERVRRGGGTTAHNPGQAIIYPIIKLKSVGLGVNEYIRTLEDIGIELLEQFGVQGQTRKGYPGVWVKKRKVASIGVRLKHWVTMHGMAVNINNDLGIFKNMVPCGLDGIEMTSVKRETGKETDMPKVKAMLAELSRKYWA